MKGPVVYVMASMKKGTLYIGVTSNLNRRVYEHKNHLLGGFTAKYKCIYLVFCQYAETMEAAIAREKQLKSWSRKKKINLIESSNPEWIDLYSTIG